MNEPNSAALRLTERVACAGCASKLGPAELAQILGGLPPSNDPNVLVGFETGDDAGVYRLDQHTALVQTVDFFTPVVDDPYGFGQIAAANALSDVYAMGGRPLTALSIAAFPERDFPPEWAASIVRGGHDKLREAGCVLLGGHTVRDPEVKFGYAITGLVDPARILSNAGAAAGDVLVLTKPLGTGVIATALKAGKAPAEAASAAARSMATLNRLAAATALRLGVRAATDVTGFGLVGHAWNIARESHVSLELELAELPLLPGARELALAFQPGGLKSNRRAYEAKLADRAAPDDALRALCFDPQTSGGLLLPVPASAVAALLDDLKTARVIGRVSAQGERPIMLI
jgi:selenide,water dikinase